MLSWHYRSRDESLIAFSNAFYYEGRLASLPSPGSDPTTGVEMRRLQGHFNREDEKNGFRTNRVEAEAIVAEIQRRLADPELSEQSIGVVTFNAQQRDLVLNLLEESNDPLVARQLREDAHEGIFVKNLENVQGDERDVILFSVAFSKRDDASPLPMNFGPLGTAGGEKRLNVAITRARGGRCSYSFRSIRATSTYREPAREGSLTCARTSGWQRTGRAACPRRPVALSSAPTMFASASRRRSASVATRSPATTGFRISRWTSWCVSLAVSAGRLRSCSMDPAGQRALPSLTVN
jgi:hypothetical protein